MAWEYKIVHWSDAPGQPRPVERREQWLEELSEQGWLLCAANEDFFFFRRTKDAILEMHEVMTGA